MRTRTCIDADWRFELGDNSAAPEPAFDDSAWRRLDLPHDFSIEATPHPDWIPGRLLLTVGFVMALTGRNSAVFLAIDSGYHGGEQLPERGS